MELTRKLTRQYMVRQLESMRLGSLRHVLQIDARMKELVGADNTNRLNQWVMDNAPHLDENAAVTAFGEASRLVPQSRKLKEKLRLFKAIARNKSRSKQGA